MPQQIAFRIADELADAIDKLIAQGRYQTRVEVLRTALASFVQTECRRAVDEAIVDGYRRMPESDDELAPAYAAAARLATDPDLPW
ncbi:MAG: ribbon-helix-helix domain-containing protein [Egibacteraceae bacterium]